ncbi:hypothetical protein L7F22_052081 [Adiantum nelumboides]|nr:hypothetical protein [Adiantum nelumboides]
MRVKVTDFGSAKIKKKAPNKPATATPATNEEQERASSFVGTAEYVSPELLTDKSVTERSDLWRLAASFTQLSAVDLRSRCERNSNDLAEVRRQAQDDADDDDSSISDSGPSPRRRGFSTGSAMAERMLGAKRSSNIMRIAAGITGSSSGSSSNNNNNNNDGGRAPRGPTHRSSFGPTALGSSGGRLLQQVPLSQHLSIEAPALRAGLATTRRFVPPNPPERPFSPPRLPRPTTGRLPHRQQT